MQNSFTYRSPSEVFLPALPTKRATMADKLQQRLAPYWQSVDTLVQGLGRSADRRLRELTDPGHHNYDHRIEKTIKDGIINYKLKDRL